MSALPWRLAFCLALSLPMVLDAQAPSQMAASDFSSQSAAIALRGSPTRQHAQSFLLQRVVRGQSAAALRMRGMGQRIAVPQLASSNQPWQPVGPSQVVTPRFGSVTGRVTSIAVAPWDASGNTVYLGATGGGVWRSSNAAATDASTVVWQPLTDDLAAYSGVNVTSLSIGAVSVQPGTSSTNAIVLAGTGDPNDALDSYYGAGILRSADGGSTWSLITQSSDAFSGGLTNYSFVGEAFSGFAWSTASSGLVVAAVTDSLDTFVNNINNSGIDSGASNVAEAGLYYSTDAGQTWHLSTIEDGPNQVIESSQTTMPSAFPGVPVTSVVWNPARKMFFAAVQYHGYYGSSDGVTWTRLANQPGPVLTVSNCPSNPGSTGSNSCAIFRGALAVQPVTGDMFTLTVDSNNLDEGLWQDVCNAGAQGCANSTVQFGTQIPDTPLDAGSGNGTIPQGTYNLALAAVANQTDTLLFAGTQDVFRCGLAAGCTWRNTTNSTTCTSAQVAPAEHAIASLGAPAGQTLPLLYFGNDGGLWRSVDGVNQTGAPCASTDAAHYQNLNGGLGSLSEATGLADSNSDANVVLAGFGVNGSAASATSSLSAWPQLLSGEGGQTAIDPTNANNWYATLGPYVAIGQCVQGAGCSATDFAPAIGAAETANDQSLLYAPYALDSADSANITVGTCRVWRGPASGGWSATNAISPMLDGHAQPSCNGNALVRSVASGGPDAQPGSGSVNAGANTGAQVIYAGMAGELDGGGASVGGHVFSTQTANTANGTTQWTDLARNPVTNEQSYSGVFNPYIFDVSSLYVDPHDTTGNTVYATIQGFGAPHLYLSTNGGSNWVNITKNLPDLPLNAVVVDPGNASVVYVASDGGVFVTPNIANCELSGGQCWNILGTGLPLAPAVALAVTTAGGGFLRVGTYGRGIWQTPLLSGVPLTTMTLAPSALTFSGQQVQTTSGPQTVTVTNSGSVDLTVGNVAVTGDFLETNGCTAALAPSSSCQIPVSFSPSATGTRNGVLTVSGNIPGGQQTVSLTGTGTTQTAISIVPNVAAFGGQQINTTSAAQQVTVSNTSGSAIALTSESVSGPFPIQVNTCSATLAANTGCTLAIVFDPTQTGQANGTLSVVSGQGTETIGLSGTGESAATDTLTPMSLAFPPTLENTVSAPQTVTLSNSGGAPLSGIQVQATGDFAVVDGCSYSLNAQSACSLTVRYTPHAAGPETGSMTVTDILRSQVVQMTGTGTAPPTDTLSSTSLVFPATPVGQTATAQSVTLTNSGDTALTQLAIQAVGVGFAETSTCGGTLAAHSSCVLTVTFHAAAAGAVAGQVDVADALRAQVISLSGSGQTAAEDNISPLALNFGGQTVGGTSPAQTVTLSNNGQAELTGIRLQSANPDYVFTTSCGATLQVGRSCGIQVAFAPHATGPDAGTLAVVDALRTQQVQMNGTGTMANMTLVPSALNFGDLGVQTSSQAQTLLLSNGSTGALTGISLTATGPFTQTNNCGTSLPSGGTCSISVVFSPNATGPQNGSVAVSAANVVAMTTHLAGTGIAFELLPTSATSVSVANGHAASYSLELMPVSGSIGNATVTCGSLPPNSTCTVNPTSASLAGASNIQVAVATGVPGAAQLRRAGIGLGPLGIGLLVILLPFLMRGRSGTIRVRRNRSIGLAQADRYLLLLVCSILLAGLVACGKGGGPLGLGTQNPLPNNSMTPPGTYTVSVTAAAGGLQKSVSLTVVVQ
ncbi:MAG: choice-of-anchor D domain-containing protein [Acidobacteriaceae bacterium]